MIVEIIGTARNIQTHHHKAHIVITDKTIIIGLIFNLSHIIFGSKKLPKKNCTTESRINNVIGIKKLVNCNSENRKIIITAIIDHKVGIKFNKNVISHQRIANLTPNNNKTK